MEKGSGRSRPLPFLFLDAVGVQERPEVAGQPHVLARRALKIHWFRAKVDGVPGDSLRFVATGRDARSLRLPGHLASRE